MGSLCVNIESGRVRDAIPFKAVQYGNTFSNETYDIYGIDLPKGTKEFFLLSFSF